MPIPDDHRAYLAEMRGMDHDSLGREVLRGLTYDETEEYYRYLRDRLEDRETSSQGSRYLDLHAKYERARLEIIMAENEARRSGPSN